MAKKVTRTAIITDQKYMGKEPEFLPQSPEMGKIELIRALSWYSHFKLPEDSTAYLAAYCEQQKLKVNLDNHKSLTYGWVARMLMRGAEIDSNTIDNFGNYIKQLGPAVAKVPVEAVDTGPLYTANKLDQWLPDFEDAVDNYSEPFDSYGYIRSHNIPQTYVRQIAEYYAPLLEELELVYAKTDEQVNEAYKSLSRVKLRSYKARVSTIIEDCGKFVGNTKKERKPRKKKVKSAESLLKYFKYQQHDDTLKIVSDDPSKIIGAAAIYVYNTRYGIATMFTAKDDTGLSINRTAIINFNEAQSVSKRVGRKKAEFIAAVGSGTKRSRPKVFDMIKSDPIKLNERINENCIILKVDK
jgi:hypothetical protein